MSYLSGFTHVFVFHVTIIYLGNIDLLVPFSHLTPVYPGMHLQRPLTLPHPAPFTQSHISVQFSPHRPSGQVCSQEGPVMK